MQARPPSKFAFSRPAPRHTLPTPTHTSAAPSNTTMATPHPPPPPSAAALTAPLAVVDALFGAAGRPAVEGDWGVAAYFAGVAADPALAAQVRARACVCVCVCAGA